MSVSVVCEECGKEFRPLETKHAEMVRRCAADGDKKLAIECPHCKDYSTLNPVAVVAGKGGAAVFTPTYRCPVSRCSGWVDYVDNEDDERPFWGCGECGSIWRKKAKLLKEIESIVKTFSYRRKCYRKSKGEWLPADPDKIPDEYDERGEDEPEDESEDSVRG